MLPSSVFQGHIELVVVLHYFTSKSNLICSSFTSFHPRFDQTSLTRCTPIHRSSSECQATSNWKRRDWSGSSGVSNRLTLGANTHTHECHQTIFWWFCLFVYFFVKQMHMRVWVFRSESYKLQLIFQPVEFPVLEINKIVGLSLSIRAYTLPSAFYWSLQFSIIKLAKMFDLSSNQYSDYCRRDQKCNEIQILLLCSKSI